MGYNQVCGKTLSIFEWICETLDIVNAIFSSALNNFFL